MQKEVIIVTIIFIIMGIFYFISHRYVNEKIEFISSSTQEVINLLNEDYKNENDLNIETINKKMDEIKTEWEEISNKLAVYIAHTELDNLTASIITLSEYTKMENYTDAIPFACKCIVQLDQLKDKENISIINLF